MSGENPVTAPHDHRARQASEPLVCRESGSLSTCSQTQIMRYQATTLQASDILHPQMSRMLLRASSQRMSHLAAPFRR